MDHGLGAVDALLVVPHEPAPPGHPSEGALDDPAAWKDFEALRGIGPFDEFEGEVEDVLETGIEFESAPACVAFVASSDSPYLGELTYPWIWSLSILFATTCTG